MNDEAGDDTLRDVVSDAVAATSEVTVAGATAASDGGARRKGRGGAPMDEDGIGGDAGTVGADRYAGKGGVFESLEPDGAGPQKSVEGWIVIATGIHEEAAEDDVVDKFSEYGPVKSVSMNLDRRTGYAKGYALLEYAERAQAEAAIKGMTGAKMLGRPLRVDWAIVSK